jgi:hypothetical protein
MMRNEENKKFKNFIHIDFTDQQATSYAFNNYLFCSPTRWDPIRIVGLVSQIVRKRRSFGDLRWIMGSQLVLY